MGHLTDAVDPHRHGIDIHHRNAPSNCGEIIVTEPGFFRVHLDEVTHDVILAPGTLAAADQVGAGMAGKGVVSRGTQSQAPLYVVY